jgi:SulP family sulfate permease
LTVAALAVPQAMAYALVAGVPVQMGLLAAALPAVAAALFGSSRFLVTGPTNPTALVIGASLVGPSVMAGTGVPVDAVLATALLTGLMLAAFGLSGFGSASRFLSDSVIAGFATGAGLLIALRQLPAVAGITEPLAESGSYLIPSALRALLAAWRAVAQADPRALLLAAGVPLVVLALRRVDPRVPGALIALAGTSALVAGLGWHEGPEALPLVGSVPAGWPGFAFPSGFDPGAVAAPALAIALLSSVQSIAAARTLDPLGGRLDPDRELFSQGVANVVAGLVGALPAGGSLTRSALGRASGARSRLAAAASGLAVMALLPLLAPTIAAVPLPALAGLVVLSGLDLVSPRALRRAGATRGDTAVLLATLTATLWIDLVQAVYVGLLLSLGLLVRRSGRLQLVEIVRAGGNRFREVPIDAETGTTPAVLLHLEGDLNFAVAPELADALGSIAARRPRVLVLRLKRARHLDATVLEVMRRQFHALQEEGTTVLLCGLTDALAELLSRTELGRELGPEGLLRAGARLFEGFERALDRTRVLLPTQSDDQIFRTEKPSAWMYEI